MTSEQSDRYAFAAQEDRSAPRTKLSLPATLRPAGGRRFQTVVRDLSLSGFSATAISRLPVGGICWLTMPGMESMQARVVWWEQGLVGCAFERLLSPVIHETILTRWRGVSLYQG
ncbi:PilZ domain-containing protein [Novosphingobium sp. M1R2S20]|uniref:PilZ domain-containing protein n=1 Tax=Novosphingobium rhizovicinum TaxID=3228928 RepID=A0ABV3R760_9SPHN